jgi:hypothetical protein
LTRCARIVTSAFIRRSFSQLELLARQDLRAGAQLVAFESLSGRSGLACRKSAGRTDEAGEVVEVQALGHQVGAQERNVPGYVHAGVAGDVAVADRPLKSS